MVNNALNVYIVDIEELINPLFNAYVKFDKGAETNGQRTVRYFIIE